MSEPVTFKALHAALEADQAAHGYIAAKGIAEGLERRMREVIGKWEAEIDALLSQGNRPQAEQIQAMLVSIELALLGAREKETGGGDAT